MFKRRVTENYRKIYTESRGEIPRDVNGRSFEIHHIDGDHTNNSPDNLVAVSIEEHYRIHLEQQDYNAARLIAVRMDKSPEEISRLAREGAKKQSREGRNYATSKEGRKQTSIRFITLALLGKHPMQKENNRKACGERQKRLAAEGNHPSQTPEFKDYISERTREWNKTVLANNEHPFQTEEVKHMVSERTREMNIKNAREGKMYAQSKEGRHRISELGKKNAGIVTVFDIDGNPSRMTKEEYRIIKQSAISQEEQTYVTGRSREGIRRLTRRKMRIENQSE